MTVLALPPRESFSSRVILESLYGMCDPRLLGSLRALMTFPRANRPLLMCTDSVLGGGGGGGGGGGRGGRKRGEGRGRESGRGGREGEKRKEKGGEEGGNRKVWRGVNKGYTKLMTDQAYAKKAIQMCHVPRPSSSLCAILTLNLP